MNCGYSDKFSTAIGSSAFCGSIFSAISLELPYLRLRNLITPHCILKDSDVSLQRLCARFFRFACAEANDAKPRSVHAPSRVIEANYKKKCHDHHSSNRSTASRRLGSVAQPDLIRLAMACDNEQHHQRPQQHCNDPFPRSLQPSSPAGLACGNCCSLCRQQTKPASDDKLKCYESRSTLHLRPPAHSLTNYSRINICAKYRPHYTIRYSFACPTQYDKDDHLSEEGIEEKAESGPLLDSGPQSVRSHRALHSEKASSGDVLQPMDRRAVGGRRGGGKVPRVCPGSRRGDGRRRVGEEEACYSQPVLADEPGGSADEQL